MINVVPVLVGNPLNWTLLDWALIHRTSPFTGLNWTPVKIGLLFLTYVSIIFGGEFLFRVKGLESVFELWHYREVESKLCSVFFVVSSLMD